MSDGVRFLRVSSPKADEVDLALSGGGFRATLFHLGALLRINEIGYLPKLSRVVSVSGGSILGAFLCLRWPDIDFDGRGVGNNLGQLIVEPLMTFCSRNIELQALGSLARRWPSRGPGGLLSDAYSRCLLGDATLADLPDVPRSILVSTDLHSAAPFILSKSVVGCHALGYGRESSLRLSDCVAASSAFPPVFSPFVLRLNASLRREHAASVAESDVRAVYLADGGVLDNTGFGQASRHASVLVSDAGKRIRPLARTWLSKTWLALAYRAFLVAQGAVDPHLRRNIIKGLASGKPHSAYWAIDQRPSTFGVENLLECSEATVQRLSQVRTRLNPFSDEEQKSLINFGYALADASLRRHVVPGLRRPGRIPFAEAPLA